MTTRLIAAAATAALAAAGLTGPAHAVVVTNTTQRDAPFAVASDDLLQTSLAGTTATGVFSREGETGVRALTDGGFGAEGSVVEGNTGLAAATADGSNSVTYTLAGAYNLTGITTYAGWDAFRGGQSYTVSVATASAPATFTRLATEYNDAQGGGNVDTRAVITPLSGLLAANVVAVRFDFGGDLTYGYAGYREIDVFGATVPEPAAGR